MKNLDINTYYEVNEQLQFSIESVRQTYRQQAEALSLMANNLDQREYLLALEFMYNCQGHVIICGMGKSGHVGKKIAATLASTGTPSFFLHPSEAFHGDLGMITKDDVIILISNSGETDEVLQLIPSLKSFGNNVIAITGNSQSTLASNADATLQILSDKEACPNNLAPTTSTTVTIAIGDALAVALMHRRRFQPNDFARFHPGGSLGRRLLTRVKDEMTSENLPLVSKDMPVTDVIVRMNESRAGVAIVTEEQRLIGIITDGDLRRSFTHEKPINALTAQEIMSSEPKTTYENEMLIDAEAKMQQFKIGSLVVLNDQECVVGLIQIFNI